ncbi:MAG TPA: methyltransferase domain-containing protein [Bryobacteraceae bacterium]|nr:methyltransferase domain-containing protein [Bryobacteraceae bacterium]
MTLSIRDSVRDTYSAAAAQPSESHPFPVGRSFAESIGYSIELLKSIPDDCVDRFAGVSNISVTAQIPAGATVLDLGCGAGLDSMIASWRIGARGRVVGVDFSPVMLDQARRGTSQAGIENTLFCRADAERLPLPDASIDVALVNGIFNLNPARECIFHELARVVRKGGTVHAAELILSAPLPPAEQNAANWFA